MNAMKNKLIIVFTFTLIVNTFAQTPDSAKTPKNWTKGGITGLNFTQSSFTNWAAGGENALSFTAATGFFANYKKGNWTWDNNIDLAYGLLKSGEDKFRKNEDKIDFTSKLGRYAFYNHWYYTALVNFKSQFDAGYNLPDDSTIVSHFLAPGYVLGSIGLDYKSTNNSLNIFISPVTSRTTIVNNQRLADNGAYGVQAAKYDTLPSGVYGIVQHGEMIRNEFGGYMKLTFKKDIFKNVNYSTKLELFSNYLDRPENIDVLWENILNLKVNKFLTASISTNMIYDHDIPVPVRYQENGVTLTRTGPRLQFKQVLAIGFVYNFGNPKK